LWRCGRRCWTRWSIDREPGWKSIEDGDVHERMTVSLIDDIMAAGGGLTVSMCEDIVTEGALARTVGLAGIGPNQPNDPSNQP
jgi:hypothetical protein